MTIAFDVDGTLLDEHDKPREEIVAILKALSRAGHDIFVWSGGGVSYAEQRVRDLDLKKYSKIKGCIQKSAGSGIDMCFDDQEVNLARVNVRV